MKQATNGLIESLSVIVLCALLVISAMIGNDTAGDESHVVTSTEINTTAFAGVTLSTMELLDQELSTDTNDVDVVAMPLEEVTMTEDNEIILPEFEPYDMYVNVSFLNVRSGPSTDFDVIGKLNINDNITIVGEANDEWLIIEYGDDIAYIASEYTQETSPEEDTYNYDWEGPKLDKFHGTCQGPSGKETYYNLNMAKCIYYMQQLGCYEKYWVRSDGTKMYGKNVMVAADLHQHPKGSLVETSLGMGIVVDTGDFASNGSGVSLDIATAW